MEDFIRGMALCPFHNLNVSVVFPSLNCRPFSGQHLVTKKCVGDSVTCKLKFKSKAPKYSLKR